MAAKKKNDRVVELLQEAINVRQSRNQDYGAAYLRHGEIVKAFFPDGITLVDESDMSRFAILDIIFGKLLRYASNFEKGGHDDSLKDIAVYSNMLRELDEITKQ